MNKNQKVKNEERENLGFSLSSLAESEYDSKTRLTIRLFENQVLSLIAQIEQTEKRELRKVKGYLC